MYANVVKLSSSTRKPNCVIEKYLFVNDKTFSSRFENAFGEQFIFAANATYLNSVLQQIKAILKLDITALNSLCGSGLKDAAFSLSEWSVLMKLCGILNSFAEAADSLELIVVDFQSYKL